MTSLILPSDLTAEATQQLQVLGQESAPDPAPFPVDELFIRHWCETLQDGNPLYLDQEFARANGLDGLMLPPVAVYSVSAMPFRWPWPPAGGTRPMIHFHVKEILDLPVALATESETEFLLPVQIGDRIAMGSRLVSVSAWKKTRLGEGRFFVYAHSFWNQQLEKVAEQRFTIFAYGRGNTKPDLPKGGYSNAIEEMLEGDKTCYQPVIAEGLFWEDVNAGDALPEIHMPITLTRCVMMASATRDFSPQHSNSVYAQQRSKTRDVFVNTQFNMGMVSRLVTDWAGPAATVRRIKITMRNNVCAGDSMIVTGNVIRKYQDNGEHRVDIDVMIANQDEPTTPCSVTVALPSRR